MIFNDHWHFFLSVGLKARETGAYGSVRHSMWEKPHLNQGFLQQLPVTPQLSLPFLSCCTHDSTWKLPVQQAIGKNGCGWINKTCLWLRQCRSRLTQILLNVSITRNWSQGLSTDTSKSLKGLHPFTTHRCSKTQRPVLSRVRQASAGLLDNTVQQQISYPTSLTPQKLLPTQWYWLS